MKLNDKCFLQRLSCVLPLRILYLLPTPMKPSIDKKWSRKFTVDRHFHLRLNLSQHVTYLGSICHFQHVTYFRMGGCAVG